MDIESSKKKISTIQWFLLFLVVFLGFSIRIFDLKEPPLDFHPMRQLRSALISRSIYYQMEPSFSQDEKDQAVALGRLEAFEPPILESLVGLTYKIVGEEILWVSRIYNALFWCIGGLALFGLMRRFISFYAALSALGYYFFLPFGIIASRSFQPEPWMIMWFLLASLALLKWMEERNWKWAILAGILGSIAVIVKVISGIFILGVFAFSILSIMGLGKALKSRQIWTMALIISIPSVLIYLFGDKGSAGFLSFWTGALSWMILDPGFYADWLAMLKSLMGGLIALVISALGAVLYPRNGKPILLGLWFGYIFYGLIFPYQYATHEYYHLPLVPILAISFAMILDLVIQKVIKEHWFWKITVSGILFFSAFYGFYVGRSMLVANNYEFEPLSWKNVGEAIPIGKKVIALTGDNGMRLRYYGWRDSSVWPSTGDQQLHALSGGGDSNVQASFDYYTDGKDLFLITSYSQFEAQAELKNILENNYTVSTEGNGFILYDLNLPLE
ncbi:MAG: glycosyltransferase family 39 protein [Anaerolineaceae bacterium]|nr:glycosyltransferase family 39 protein [Anaerolineaceae bacterium]